ncbi:MAG: serine protease [Clostridia bacterium]|nr:serine protease [Clostridia bacterium]
MKKRWMKWISMVVVAVIALFGATACQQLTRREGLSAYEIALKNGFVGTEEEWLLSLKGQDGDDGADMDINAMYEAAKADGFQGSMSDFLKEYFNVEVGKNTDVETLAHNVMSTVSIMCVFDEQVNGSTQKVVSTGSGVIYHLEKANGRAYIITNYHVIYETGTTNPNGVTDDIYCYLYGAKNSFSAETYTDESGDAMRARVVGGSRENDIAVLAIEGSEYLKNSQAEAVRVRAESSPVYLGEKVYVVGNAGGRGISVSDGVVAVESEYIALESLNDPAQATSHRVMRTDAVVNKGNSGGGLFDAYGQLVGIVNAKSNGLTLDNVGYAIHIDRVCRIADEVIATGKADKGLLGVTLQVETSYGDIDAHGRLSIVEKITVKEAPTDENSSAYGVLENGDIIKKITIEGKTHDVTRLYLVGELLILAEAGDTIELEIERAGVMMTKAITFAAKHMVTI